MPESSRITEYLKSMTANARFKDQVVYQTVLPSITPRRGIPEKPWPAPITEIMRALDIPDLYLHQAKTVDHIRSGRHVTVATSTASGKTLAYNLPALEKFQNNPEARALYVFPLKALAQDQLHVFERMAGHCRDPKPKAAIYDGDTSAWFRRRIRERPPNIILTNPEMLHLSFLQYHWKWVAFLSKLEMVVLDEVHEYRGIMGSNMAQVFRRFQRICDYYGASPTYVFSSATVANPKQLAGLLTGYTVATVTRGSASHGKRHMVFINPIDGPVQTAILLLKAALHRGLRTIVYTQSRKLTELIALWAGNKSSPYADRISAYRAGFLPEERRNIESKLATGELLAVVATSALELGIDIGDLDLCILVGYPGSVMATWQRSGRVGRSGQDSAMILIAGEDALDQYFMRYPETLMRMAPEPAVINPFNPDVMKKHLVCAAAELPLKIGEPLLAQSVVMDQVKRLVTDGQLLESADGTEIYSGSRFPHRKIGLRGTGVRFNIFCAKTGQHIGEIDGFRAFRETHPGAVYLHHGKTYLVDRLDTDANRVEVSEADVDYYTKVRGHKNTEIIEIDEQRHIESVSFGLGRLRVTDQVTGYERRHIRKKNLLNVISLELPPVVFETDGIWFNIPAYVQQDIESQHLHFLGGIHAVEHAVIGMFPLLVLTDRNDLGGISTMLHPQIGSAAIFIYDAVPGGAGLTRQAFQQAGSLLKHAFDVIRACPCETGCPSCVHSPKCGSGNRPIDKASALAVLDRLAFLFHTESFESEAPRGKSPTRQSHYGDGALKGLPAKANTGGRSHRSADGMKSLGALSAGDHVGKPCRPTGKTDTKTSRFKPGSKTKRRVRWTAKPALNQTDQSGETNGSKTDLTEGTAFGVLDIETQRSAQEVGGWHNADRMLVSCAVLYDSKEDAFLEFLEDQIPLLIEHLAGLDLVVGFNIERFDYRVLSGYSDTDFRVLPTLDILSEVHRRLGYRLSLGHLAEVTLGIPKTADGLQALRWWQEGRLREIIDYCKHDVKITRDLYLYGKNKGYLLFKNKAGNTVRIPVDW
jgi:DEAD/DEAH box helicase domain-containing protein